MTTRFDQAAYWRERGNVYVAEFEGHSAETTETFRRQEEELEAALAQVDLAGVRSMIEVGCGFGRLTPIVQRHTENLERYVGLDVSPGQVTAAEKVYDGKATASFVLDDFRSVELEPADLLFAGEVFLHFPPAEIGSVLDRALDLAPTVIHLDPYLPIPGLTGVRTRISWTIDHLRRRAPLQTTNWAHDYPRYYPRRRVIIFPILDASQHLFVATA